MNPTYLRMIGIGLNVVGAIILAIRVKKILDALCAVASVHEFNIQQLNPANPNRNIVQLTNSPVQVEKAKRLGTWLLVLGFGLLGLGNLLNGLGIWLSVHH